MNQSYRILPYLPHSAIYCVSYCASSQLYNTSHYKIHRQKKENALLKWEVFTFSN